MTARRGMV